MKIAMIGHKRIPSREGGIEIVVGELSSRLAAMGHTVVAYNRRGHHVSGKKFETQKLKEYRGVKLKTVFTFESSALNALVYSILAAIRASFSSFDVVHFHAEGPAAMCFLPKLFGKKTVVTIHGLDWQRSKWGGFASKYLKFGEKNAAKYADSIIVLSENVKKYFIETYGRSTVFIPNGVTEPEPAGDEVIKEKYNIKEDGYILFLGRLVPEKGIHRLIEAYKSIDTEMPLVIAGGSSHSGAYLNELKEAAAGADIIFTDFVDGEVLRELYSNAYIYVLPSDLEGMPLSLLEAMSYGCCCLTSDIPECTEVCREHAVYFKKGDAKDLALELEHLLSSPAAHDKIKNGACEFIMNKYSWDSVAEKTLKLYGGNI